MPALVSLLALVFLLAACGETPAPPARTSPELEAFHAVSLGDAEVRSRGGVTMVFDGFGDDGNVLAVDAEGTHLVRASDEPTEGLCVIGAGRGVRITETQVEIFDGDSAHHAATVSEVFGAPAEVLFAQCSALSLDEVWVQAGSRLAHWDGERWSAETLPFELGFEHGLSVTEQFLYVNGADALHRRPRAGGAFEPVVTDGEDRVVREVDATRAGVLIVDMYDVVVSAELLADAGGTTVVAVDGTVDGWVDPEHAWFDRSGRLWAGVLLTAGETETSFGGSTTRYYPDWYQVVIHRADASGALAEVAHHDHVYAMREQGPETLRVIVSGDDAIFGFRGELFRLPE